ncbi:unnamed protein product [Urochloa humidicola]
MLAISHARTSRRRTRWWRRGGRAPCRGAFARPAKASVAASRLCTTRVEVDGALADREHCDEEGAEGIVEDEEAVEEVVVGDDSERMVLQREVEELVEDAGDPASPGVYITWSFSVTSRSLGRSGDTVAIWRSGSTWPATSALGHDGGRPRLRASPSSP